ncbi:hypothetical protein CXG81DRAFT_24898 [Caulochytrium protostelioides]|uniref:Uncharacterized protein n=1 Tax=Caulochytrium protostelioides TaxID=1555241 RepID=A0A4P9XAR8_9FUNG|nr:hypothetical protein CXG81DRAFT_24898 [Caulochytrium protostelioides]|eukprot:RKP02436.1 hypothetical protein CXG81DRAFT_24898 [Caulochytrium protostelioides]
MSPLAPPAATAAPTAHAAAATPPPLLIDGGGCCVYNSHCYLHHGPVLELYHQLGIRRPRATTRSHRLNTLTTSRQPRENFCSRPWNHGEYVAQLLAQEALVGERSPYFSAPDGYDRYMALHLPRPQTMSGAFPSTVATPAALSRVARPPAARHPDPASPRRHESERFRPTGSPPSASTYTEWPLSPDGASHGGPRSRGPWHRQRSPQPAVNDVLPPIRPHTSAGDPRVSPQGDIARLARRPRSPSPRVTFAHVADDDHAAGTHGSHKSGVSDTLDNDADEDRHDAAYAAMVQQLRMMWMPPSMAWQGPSKVGRTRTQSMPADGTPSAWPDATATPAWHSDRRRPPGPAGMAASPPRGAGADGRVDDEVAAVGHGVGGRPRTSPSRRGGRPSVSAVPGDDGFVVDSAVGGIDRSAAGSTAAHRLVGDNGRTGSRETSAFGLSHVFSGSMSLPGSRSGSPEPLRDGAVADRSGRSAGLAAPQTASTSSTMMYRSFMLDGIAQKMPLNAAGAVDADARPVSGTSAARTSARGLRAARARCGPHPSGAAAARQRHESSPELLLFEFGQDLDPDAMPRRPSSAEPPTRDPETPQRPTPSTLTRRRSAPLLRKPSEGSGTTGAAAWVGQGVSLAAAALSHAHLMRPWPPRGRTWLHGGEGDGGVGADADATAMAFLRGVRADGDDRNASPQRWWPTGALHGSSPDLLALTGDARDWAAFDGSDDASGGMGASPRGLALLPATKASLPELTATMPTRGVGAAVARDGRGRLYGVGAHGRSRGPASGGVGVARTVAFLAMQHSHVATADAMGSHPEFRHVLHGGVIQQDDDSEADTTGLSPSHTIAGHAVGRTPAGETGAARVRFHLDGPGLSMDALNAHMHVTKPTARTGGRPGKTMIDPNARFVITGAQLEVRTGLPMGPGGPATSAAGGSAPSRADLVKLVQAMSQHGRGGGSRVLLSDDGRLSLGGDGLGAPAVAAVRRSSPSDADRRAGARTANPDTASDAGNGADSRGMEAKRRLAQTPLPPLPAKASAASAAGAAGSASTATTATAVAAVAAGTPEATVTSPPSSAGQALADSAVPEDTAATADMTANGTATGGSRFAGVGGVSPPSVAPLGAASASTPRFSAGSLSASAATGPQVSDQSPGGDPDGGAAHAAAECRALQDETEPRGGDGGDRAASPAPRPATAEPARTTSAADPSGTAAVSTTSLAGPAIIRRSSAGGRPTPRSSAPGTRTLSGTLASGSPPSSAGRRGTPTTLPDVTEATLPDATAGSPGSAAGSTDASALLSAIASSTSVEDAADTTVSTDLKAADDATTEAAADDDAPRKKHKKSKSKKDKHRRAAADAEGTASGDGDGDGAPKKAKAPVMPTPLTTAPPARPELVRRTPVIHKPAATAAAAPEVLSGSAALSRTSSLRSSLGGLSRGSKHASPRASHLNVSFDLPEEPPALRPADPAASSPDAASAAAAGASVDAADENASAVAPSTPPSDMMPSVLPSVESQRSTGDASPAAQTVAGAASPAATMPASWEATHRAAMLARLRSPPPLPIPVAGSKPTSGGPPLLRGASAMIVPVIRAAPKTGGTSDPAAKPARSSNPFYAPRRNGASGASTLAKTFRFGMDPKRMAQFIQNQERARAVPDRIKKRALRHAHDVHRIVDPYDAAAARDRADGSADSLAAALTSATASSSSLASSTDALADTGLGEEDEAARAARMLAYCNEGMAPRPGGALLSEAYLTELICYVPHQSASYERLKTKSQLLHAEAPTTTVMPRKYPAAPVDTDHRVSQFYHDMAELTALDQFLSNAEWQGRHQEALRALQDEALPGRLIRMLVATLDYMDTNQPLLPNAMCLAMVAVSEQHYSGRVATTATATASSSSPPPPLASSRRRRHAVHEDRLAQDLHRIVAGLPRTDFVTFKAVLGHLHRLVKWFPTDMTWAVAVLLNRYLFASAGPDTWSASKRGLMVEPTPWLSDHDVATPSRPSVVEMAPVGAGAGRPELSRLDLTASASPSLSPSASPSASSPLRTLRLPQLGTPTKPSLEDVAGSGLGADAAAGSDGEDERPRTAKGAAAATTTTAAAAAAATAAVTVPPSKNSPAEPTWSRDEVVTLLMMSGHVPTLPEGTASLLLRWFKVVTAAA